MINKRSTMFIGLLITVILVGCSTSQTPASTITAISPVKLTSVVTALEPKVTTDQGALKVTLVSTYTNLPLSNSDISLGEMIPMKGSMEGVYIPKLSTAGAPYGTTDNNGALVISNIKPGKYALVYIYPFANGMPALISLQNSDKEISFDIVEGKVSDLGSLMVAIDPARLH